MTTTRTQRLNALARSLELEADAAAVRIAQAELAAALAERTADGIAPVEPSALYALFAHAPAEAWAQLAKQSEAQLVCQAIEYRCFVERELEAKGLGHLTWGDILRSWQARLAARAAALVELKAA